MPRFAQRTARILAALGAMFAASRARADAAAANDSVTDPTVVRSRVGLEAHAATFRLPQGAGRYETAAFSFDAAAAGLVSVRAVLPFHALTLDRQETRTGVGDFDLKLKVRVLETPRWVVATGVDAQYPTGSASRGLGGGALQIGPFLTAGYEIAKVIVYGTVTGIDSFRPPGAPEQTSFVDPSTDRELLATLGVIARADASFLLNLSATEIIVLTPGQRGHRLTTAQPQAGIAFSRAWRATLGLELPVHGERRFEARGTLAVFHFF